MEKNSKDVFLHGNNLQQNMETVEIQLNDGII
jgi:hypothetical protein